MADISKIALNGSTYDLKDTTARNGVSTNATNITNLGNRVTALESYHNGIVICIGDSYLSGWTPDGNVENWGTKLCNLMGKTLNTDFFNFDYGGTGFNNTVDGKNFGTLCTSASEDSRFSNDNVGLVIFGGGFNDQSAGYSDLVLKVTQTVNLAKSYFANAKIIVANMGWSQIVASYRSNYYNKSKVSEAYFAGAAGAGVSCFSNCWCALFGLQPASNAELLASDDVHPTNAGETEIAKALMNFIESGHYNPDFALLATSPSSALFAKPTADTTTFFLTGVMNMNTAWFSALSGSLNGDQTGGIHIDLPSIPGCEPVTDFKGWGSATILLHDSTNGYKFVDCIVGFSGGKIRLCPCAVNANGSNYMSVTNIDSGAIYSLSLSVPTNML